MVKFAPSPTNDVAVIARPVALIPPEVTVTTPTPPTVPITALVAVITPALTICLLSSIIFEPESLIAIFRKEDFEYLELFSWQLNYE
mgnify:CR=1 FL=1